MVTFILIEVSFSLFAILENVCTTVEKYKIYTNAYFVALSIVNIFFLQEKMKLNIPNFTEYLNL
jgi:hypothetical protein